MRARWLVLTAALLAGSSAVAGDYVQGYYRSDGKYVQGYVRSSPDSSRSDNYSSEGNINPYTGAYGTERHEFSSKPQYNDSYGNGYGKTLNELYGND